MRLAGVTSAAHRLRRRWILVAVLVAALLAGQAVDLATAAAAGAKNERTQEKKDKKGKKPRRRPVAKTISYGLKAEGGYEYFRVRHQDSPPWSSTATERVAFKWAGAGVATITTGPRPDDFRVAGGGVIAPIDYSEYASTTVVRPNYDNTPTSCSDSLTTVPTGTHQIVLGLSGTKPADLTLGVPTKTLPGTNVRSASGPQICASPVTGSFPTQMTLRGPDLTYYPSVAPGASNSCSGGGSPAAGWKRTCSTTVRLPDGATRTWTLNLSITAPKAG